MNGKAKPAARSRAADRTKMRIHRRTTALVLLLAFAPSGAPASTGAHVWSKRLGGSSADLASSIAVDASQNVLVAGYTYSYSLDLGGGSLVTSGGRSDLLLAKYAPDGSHLWSKRLGDPGYLGETYAMSVAADPSSNVLLAGFSRASFGVDLGCGSMPVGSSADAIIAKFTPDGQCLWSRRQTNAGDDQAFVIASDASANVIVGGQAAGPSGFGGDPVEGHGWIDTFIAKFSPDGTLAWYKLLGGRSADLFGGLTTDRSGNVIVIGTTISHSPDMGGGPLVSPTSVPEQYRPTSGPWHGDMVIAKYSPDGSHLWSKRFGGTHWDAGFSVATDAAGNLLLSGYTDSAMLDACNPVASIPASAVQLPCPRPGTGADIYVAKLSPGGDHIWSKRLAGAPPPGGSYTGVGDALEVGSSVAATPSGDVLLLGATWSSAIDMGGGSLQGFGSEDLVVARYAADGTHVWSKRLGGSRLEATVGPVGGPKIVSNEQGASYLVGITDSPVIDVGGGPLESFGNFDLLIAGSSDGTALSIDAATGSGD